MKKSWRMLLAVSGGMALSVVALGVLWAGTPWHLQALMFCPFLLLAFVVTRSSSSIDNSYRLIIFGALPLGTIMTMFRDSNNSHLPSILVVCAWLAGILAGHGLAAKLPRRTRADVAAVNAGLNTAPATRCPLCGGQNNCAQTQVGAGAAACWCRDVAFSTALLEAVPADQRGRRCICKACATAAIEKPGAT